MDCGLPSFSVHGILQARTLEWVAVPSSRRSSQPRNRTQVSCTAGGFFTIWGPGKPMRGQLLSNQMGPSPSHSKAGLLTSGCGEEKCSVYCRVPSKEFRTASVQKGQNSLWISGRHLTTTNWYLPSVSAELNHGLLQLLTFSCGCLVSKLCPTLMRPHGL